ncbi:Hypothetical protein LOCK900_0456 [Lacticaseibacillus rhamnosus LOCK900]|uniref:Uncharacterized protein n=1 Tax=Lacticaseibacillus rhamnosus LRHMDP3 TaxID=1203259 RepID=A0AB33XU28_LACRH|nr:Hypothetical protein LOCK900_0456 [Lacticaseibacillus rhamnosus LOCK900]ASY49412.1 hypothetical protein N507_2241 [Lacticaseibacillus rhamnosus DSM 14870]EHJ34949.1 hypothetical protein HMPREF0541_00594 [Lacticaseibacillus rhamnosus ATCC 21052]EKS50595.1 hypothetical protein LRHMDP3_1766 [Lacticaseibacillus rhamnosus LRHMDP3]EKS53924.1 hypothetical protein LRHMDP2_165 [Lacticaseibacillus rhamnosus LRHMDP2]
MAKERPSRLRPLTLRFQTGLAHAHSKKTKLTKSVKAWSFCMADD